MRFAVKRRFISHRPTRDARQYPSHPPAKQLHTRTRSAGHNAPPGSASLGASSHGRQMRPIFPAGPHATRRRQTAFASGLQSTISSAVEDQWGNIAEDFPAFDLADENRVISSG